MNQNCEFCIESSRFYYRLQNDPLTSVKTRRKSLGKDDPPERLLRFGHFEWNCIGDDWVILVEPRFLPVVANKVPRSGRSGRFRAFRMQKHVLTKYIREWANGSQVYTPY